MQMFARLTKVNEADRTVEGIIASEAVDKSGEVFDYDRSKPNFMKWSESIAKATDGKSLGNVRVMHGKQVAGITKALNFDDAEKMITVKTEIVDDNEWNKVKKGCYTGFSIGGRYVDKWDDPVRKGVKRYEADPTEFSLVDLPCNPQAQFTVVKADGSEELRKFETSVDDAEALAKWVETLTDDQRDQLAKIAQRKGVDPKEGEDKYGKDADFADPKNKKYPLDTAEHIRAAWSYIHMPKNAKKYDAADLKTIKSRIVSAWKKKIDPKGPPKAEKDWTPEAQRLTKRADAADVGNAIQSLLGEPAMEKGLWTVGVFANLLEQLCAIADGTVFEEKNEGDGSPLPQHMAAALKPLAAVFLEMAQEETNEALHGQLNDDASIELAARNDMTKSETEQLAELTKRFDALQAEHDALKKGGSDTKTLQKAITERDDMLAKAAQRITEQGELIAKYAAMIDELNKQPEPVRAALRVVSKGQDLPGSSAKEIEPVLKADGTEDKVATELKKALANPVIVR